MDLPEVFVSQQFHHTPNLTWNDTQNPLSVALKENGHTYPRLKYTGHIQLGFDNGNKYKYCANIKDWLNSLEKEPENTAKMISIVIDEKAKEIRLETEFHSDNPHPNFENLQEELEFFCI